jgi:hypothetical protein
MFVFMEITVAHPIKNINPYCPLWNLLIRCCVHTIIQLRRITSHVYSICTSHTTSSSLQSIGLPRCPLCSRLPTTHAPNSLTSHSYHRSPSSFFLVILFYFLTTSPLLQENKRTVPALRHNLFLSLSSFMPLINQTFPSPIRPVIRAPACAVT